jgi:3-hydroxyacyl-[acyl-carrier-protein] dehydratase
MRWCWIDKFVEAQRGRYAVSVKAVSLAEEQLFDYVPGVPVMPNSLIIEGLAQTAGVLLGEVNAFRERIVLAKVSKAIFHRYAGAGEILTYRAELRRMDELGAYAVGTSHIGDELQAEVELFFAHLDERFPGKENFAPEELLLLLRLLRFYEVARDETGAHLEIPPYLREAELAANRSSRGR